MWKKLTLMLWIMSLLVVPIANRVEAQENVPPLLNYQGKLTDTGGAALEGTHTLEINLYSSAVAQTDDPDKVWGPQQFDLNPGETPQQGHGRKVTLVNGQFNVVLGEMDTEGNSIATVFNATNRYLGIKVDGGSELEPRQQLLSTPYALRAESAVTADVVEMAETANLPFFRFDLNEKVAQFNFADSEREVIIDLFTAYPNEFKSEHKADGTTINLLLRLELWTQQLEGRTGKVFVWTNVLPKEEGGRVIYQEWIHGGLEDDGSRYIHNADTTWIPATVEEIGGVATLKLGIVGAPRVDLGQGRAVCYLLGYAVTP